MEREQLIYVWVSKMENFRFNTALKGNGDDAESLMHTWMTAYVRQYEDDLAIKRFYEINPAAKRQYEEDLAAKKLHTYADKIDK